MQALGIDPLDAQLRQVVFFDTPDLQLDRAGVVVRARRVQGAGDDSVVKLRPVVPGDLPKRLRQATEFGVEVDAMPGGFVCSGSYKGMPRKAAVVDVLPRRATGAQALQQGAALVLRRSRARGHHAGRRGGARSDHRAEGQVRAAELRRKMVAELWFYPDGSRILELSTKCAPADALRRRR